MIWHVGWMLGALLVGIMFRRFGLFLLWIIPIAMVAGNTGLMPYYLRFHELLAAAYIGWLMTSLFRRRLFDQWDIADGLVEVFGIVGFASMVAALATPSVENSLVAFGSVANPPVQSEFHAIAFAQVALLGMGFYHMVRASIREIGLTTLPRAIWFQILAMFLVSVAAVIWDWRESGRPPLLPLAWPFGGIHGAGGVAILFFGFCAGFLAFRKSGEGGFLWMIAGAVLSSLLVAPTGSKGAYLGWIVVILAVMIVLARRGAYRLLFCFGVGGVVAGLFLMFLANRLPNTELSDRINFFAKVQSWGQQESNEERLQIFQRAVTVAGSNFLSGAGLGKFAYVMEYYGKSDFQGTKDERLYENPKLVDPPYQGSAPAPYNYFMAHNSLLELAAGSGVVVSVLFVACVIAWLILVGSVQTSVSGGALMAVLAWLPMNVVDSRILSPADGVLIWQFLAIGCAATVVTPGAQLMTGRQHRGGLFLGVALFLSALMILGPSVERTSAAQRLFGTNQWMRAKPEGFYAVARHVQFSSAHLGEGGRIVLKLPESRRKASTVWIRQDGREVSSFKISPGTEVSVDLVPTQGTSWIEILTDRWATRGIGKSLFGIEPEALLVRREFGEVASSISTP